MRGVWSGTHPNGETRAALAAEWEASHLANLSALSLPEAAERLGVTSAYVEARVLAGALVAFERDDQLLVPAFQIGADGVLPRVAVVNRALDAAHDPGGALVWWLTPNPDLAPIGGSVGDTDDQWPTPAERIESEPDRVVELAESLIDADSF